MPAICLAADRRRGAGRGSVAERGRQRRRRNGAGAAAGAAIGAASGAAGAGAAIGAGAGLLAGSAVGANNAAATYGGVQQLYDISYTQCMTAQGNTRAGAANSTPPIRTRLPLSRLPLSLSVSRLPLSVSGYYGPALFAPSVTLGFGGGWGWGRGWGGGRGWRRRGLAAVAGGWHRLTTNPIAACPAWSCRPSHRDLSTPHRPPSHRHRRGDLTRTFETQCDGKLSPSFNGCFRPISMMW